MSLSISITDTDSDSETHSHTDTHIDTLSRVLTRPWLMRLSLTLSYFLRHKLSVN